MQAGGICKALRWKNTCVHSFHDLNAAFHKENDFKILYNNRYNSFNAKNNLVSKVLSTHH
jgi:hypothetical protein